MTLMIEYSVRTLDEVITMLEALEDAPVGGLSTIIVSYRGYYDRPCIEPTYPGNTHPASVLAKIYRDTIGKPMYGGKGGEFECKGSSWVHYAEYGHTGAYILGFQKMEDGIYYPVLLTDSLLLK